MLTNSMIFFIKKSLIMKMDININDLCWMLPFVLYLATTTSTKVTRLPVEIKFHSLIFLYFTAVLKKRSSEESIQQM